jgi:hypothetical protein
MRRSLCLILALMASLALPTLADAAPKKKYKPARITVSKGYGFLPGYRPPPPNGPIYERKGRSRYYGERYHDLTPRFYMYGGTGNWTIYRNRTVGPIFGPCWKHTPIGPHWTCG